MTDAAKSVLLGFRHFICRHCGHRWDLQGEYGTPWIWERCERCGDTLPRRELPNGHRVGDDALGRFYVNDEGHMVIGTPPWWTHSIIDGREL